MTSSAINVRHIARFAICLSAAPLFGYMYVSIFSGGIKPIIAFHLGILFLLGWSLFLKDLRTFLLFCVVFFIPLQIDYHLIYRPVGPEFESTPFMSGLTVDAVDLTLIPLIAWWMMEASLREKHERLRFGHPLGTVLLVWIIFGLITSAFTATHFGYSVFEAFFLLKGWLLFFYLVNNLKTRRDFRIVIWALLAGAIGQALYMVMQYVTGLNYSLHGEFYAIRGPEGFRSAGFSGGADAACQMIVHVFPIIAGYYFVAADTKRRLPTLLALLIMTLGVVSTKFRIATLALVTSVALVLLLGGARRWISGAQIFKTVVAALLFFLIISPALVQRFRVGEYGEVRVPLMVTASLMAKDNLLLGVGGGNYLFNVEKYLPYKLRFSWVHTVHNEYLRLTAERGIFGALLYYLLVILAALKFWKTSRSPDPLICIVSTGFFVAIFTSVGYRFFSIYYQPAFYLFFCVVLALAIRMDEFQRTADRAASGEGAEPDDFSKRWFRLNKWPKFSRGSQEQRLSSAT